MANFIQLEAIIASLPEVTVEPHFEKISFRVKQKIFATFDEKNSRVTIKLSVTDQDHFSSVSPSICPVDNKWGLQGWTMIELSEIDLDLLSKTLTAAYCEVAPKKLAAMVRHQ